MEERSTESTWTEWSDNDSKSRMIGAIVAGVVATGVLFAFLRRRKKAEEAKLPSGFAERTRDAIGDERLQAGRDFLIEKVLPEFKPALLSILEELEEVVDNAFRRAEKSIKKM